MILQFDEMTLFYKSNIQLIFAAKILDVRSIIKSI